MDTALSSRRRPGPDRSIHRTLLDRVAAFAWSTFLSCTLVFAPLAHAQSDQPPLQLTGTLQKIRATGSVTIGFRESSIPFSYLSARGAPIGYSIDLCRQLVDAIGDAIGRTVAIEWRKVTPETRIAAVASGAVDLECGSTTSNLERQKTVAFSPTFFVSGTKLMVPAASSIRSYGDLDGKRVVVTAGTTNEKTLRDIKQKFGLGFALSTAPDHAASFALLQSGQVDAFATDDVLLYGLIATANARGRFVVVGDFLSYDPYGVMYRKGDADFTRLVDATFQRLAEDREIERRYQRWFLQKLPSGISLDLPMSPQLDTILQTMAIRS